MNDKEMIKHQLGQNAKEIAELIEEYYDTFKSNDLISEFINWSRISMEFHLGRDEIEKALYETKTCKDKMIEYLSSV